MARPSWHSARSGSGLAITVSGGAWADITTGDGTARIEAGQPRMLLRGTVRSAVTGVRGGLSPSDNGAASTDRFSRLDAGTVRAGGLSYYADGMAGRQSGRGATPGKRAGADARGRPDLGRPDDAVGHLWRADLGHGDSQGQGPRSERRGCRRRSGGSAGGRRRACQPAKVRLLRLSRPPDRLPVRSRRRPPSPREPRCRPTAHRRRSHRCRCHPPPTSCSNPPPPGRRRPRPRTRRRSARRPSSGQGRPQVSRPARSAAGRLRAWHGGRPGARRHGATRAIRAGPRARPGSGRSRLCCCWTRDRAAASTSRPASRCPRSGTCRQDRAATCRPAPIIQGVYCKNGHFDDPEALFCAICGISMNQQTLVPRPGDRPPLGVLLLDDGSVFQLDSDYVVGREPGLDGVGRGRQREAAADQPTTRASSRACTPGFTWTAGESSSPTSARRTAPGCKLPGQPADTPLEPQVPIVLATGSQVDLGGRGFRYESHRGR